VTINDCPRRTCCGLITPSGREVTLLDASCLCQGRSKACHWSVVSFQTTPFLINEVDFTHVSFHEVVAMEAMWCRMNLQIFSLTLIILSIVQVSQKVQEALTERAASFGLILDDISLVRAYVNVVQEFNCVHSCAFRAC